MKVLFVFTFVLVGFTLSGQIDDEMKNNTLIQDNWNDGSPYEYFMGRWSSKMAVEFLTWLDPADSQEWLDLGCGTGALSKVIKTRHRPSDIICIDPSEDFLNIARKELGNAQILVGTAGDIPLSDNSVDITVLGLVLNFIPDLESALIEIKRVTKSDGLVAAYVWDYSGKMEMLRYFWDAAIIENPDAVNLDEGVRFPVCNKDKIKTSFTEAGFDNITVAEIDIETHFQNFEDYWNPFLGGQGPAPTYLKSLPKDQFEKLKARVYKSLPIDEDGSIRLIGRALSVRASKPKE